MTNSIVRKLIPHRTPFFIPWVYPDLLWRVNTSSRELFLTFDDGPVPGPTEFVLQCLKEYQVRATFFCIGDNIKKHPEIFKKVIADNHAIGNHTFNHLGGWATSDAQYKKNIDLCEEEMRKYTSPLVPGSKTLFRPPYGKITRRQIRLLKPSYEIVMWDVLSVDFSRHLPAEKCLRNTIRATRSGSVIIFHDSLKAERNLRYALPRFIEHFSGQGFSFKTLTP